MHNSSYLALKPLCHHAARFTIPQGGMNLARDPHRCRPFAVRQTSLSTLENCAESLREQRLLALRGK